MAIAKNDKNIALIKKLRVNFIKSKSIIKLEIKIVIEQKVIEVRKIRERL